MEFHVVQKGILKIKKQIDPPDGRQIVYLEKDDAGDPRKYHTQYFVSYSNATNKIRKLGSIRIGEKGLSPSERREKIMRPARQASGST